MTPAAQNIYLHNVLAYLQHVPCAVSLDFANLLILVAQKL